MAIPTAGGGQPTLREVAARAGVSLITASRALAPDKPGLPVRPATRATVQRAADELGYRPNSMARAMRGRRHDQVGALVVNNPGARLTNLAAYEYLLGLNAGLEPHGITLSLVRLTDLAGERPERVRALREQMLDGFVAISHLPAAVVERLDASGDRVVWLDTGRRTDGCCINRDEAGAGRLAAEALLAHGRRRLVLLRPTKLDHYSLGERERGVTAAAAAAAVPLELIPTGAGYLPDDPQRLRAALGPEAGLVLSTPTIALRTLALLAAWGLVPGRDLGVACCDADDLLVNGWPELTRVEIPRHGLGERAAAMLVHLLAGGGAPRSETADAALVPGGTA